MRFGNTGRSSASFDEITCSIPGIAGVSGQQAALAGIHRALRPGGRFVAEMGGYGNIAAIRTALQATLAPFNIDAEAAKLLDQPPDFRAAGRNFFGDFCEEG